MKRRLAAASAIAIMAFIFSTTAASAFSLEGGRTMACIAEYDVGNDTGRSRAPPS